MEYIYSLFRFTYIYKVVKKTMMGYIHVKTIDYYRNIDFVNIFDKYISIYYYYNNIPYIIVVDGENYSRALEYIQELKTTPIIKSNNEIKFAYYGEPIIDITDIIKQYSGPKGDFYVDELFMNNSKIINEIEDIKDDIYYLNKQGDKLKI
jgi:hypothetical protein